MLAVTYADIRFLFARNDIRNENGIALLTHFCHSHQRLRQSAGEMVVIAKNKVMRLCTVCFVLFLGCHTPNLYMFIYLPDQRTNFLFQVILLQSLGIHAGISITKTPKVIIIFFT